MTDYRIDAQDPMGDLVLEMLENDFASQRPAVVTLVTMGKSDDQDHLLVDLGTHTIKIALPDVR